MRKILLLEPDTMLGSTYAEALQAKGYKVAWCQDAQGAVDRLNAAKPDVIITELQLAKHNGVEFLYELRSYTDWQKLPVLVLSSVPLKDKVLASALWQNIGVTQYLYKPLAKLEDIIRSVDALAVAG
jgi:two-component system chemotaxis response regulator CheY